MEMESNNAALWKRKPICFRVSAKSLLSIWVMSFPSTWTAPESALMRPQMSFRVTLFPVPLRPRSA
jgi:hypothetical protein